MRRSLPFCLALLLVLVTMSAEAQVAVGRLLGSISYNSQTLPLTGWVAYLDISSGQIQPVVTPPLKPGVCTSATVQLQTTAAFALQQTTFFAVNANLGPAMPPYTPGACGTPYGLLVSNGTTVNQFQRNGPVLVFTSNKNATVSAPSSAPSATYAVAGWAGTDGTGTLLVTPPSGQGPPTPGTNAQPAPSTIAPRVGTGVTADGNILILAMIDGLEPVLGLQNFDFGNVMIGLGANAAVNLDGGGSSTFIFTPPAGATLQTPSALLTLLTSAAAPAGAINDLSFGVLNMPLTQAWTSAPPCVQPCAYRAIYANIGFTLVPSGAAKPKQD